LKGASLTFSRDLNTRPKHL